MTRARVDVLTTLALFRTRETVAVGTLARRATCSRFMSLTLERKSSALHGRGRRGMAIIVTAVTELSRPVQVNAGHVLEVGAVQRPKARVMHQSTSGDGEIDLASPRAAQRAIQIGAAFGLFSAERNRGLRWE